MGYSVYKDMSIRSLSCSKFAVGAFPALEGVRGFFILAHTLVDTKWTHLFFKPMFYLNF